MMHGQKNVKLKLEDLNGVQIEGTVSCTQNLYIKFQVTTEPVL